MVRPSVHVVKSRPCLLDDVVYGWSLRRLNMSRGSREGNNAFTKDVVKKFSEIDDFVTTGIKYNVDFKILKEYYKNDDRLLFGFDQCSADIMCAIERGHHQLVTSLIDLKMKHEKLGSGFSKFHLESLTKVYNVQR